MARLKANRQVGARVGALSWLRKRPFQAGSLAATRNCFISCSGSRDMGFLQTGIEMMT